MEKRVSARPPQKLCGILVRRERWGLSWRGHLVVISTALAIVCLVLVGIQPFLAVTDPVPASVLVIEGWIHEYAIRAGVEEFKNGYYQRVFTTGGPVVGLGGYINDYQTAAGVGADLLKKAGVPEQFIQMVPSRVVGRDRTYGSAVALREWFREHNVAVQSINVLTEDVHARRTRLLFERAFGKGVTVGIIAVPNPDYDSKHWWRYSEGLKDVFNEGIAFMYAKFFFYSAESRATNRKRELLGYLANSSG